MTTPAGKNICIFTGQLRRFCVKLVGNDKNLRWGWGTLYIPDPENPGLGVEINIQAWEDKAELLENLQTGSWVKISSAFQPTTFRGKEQSNFVVGQVAVVDDKR